MGHGSNLPFFPQTCGLHIETEPLESSDFLKNCHKECVWGCKLKEVEWGRVEDSSDSDARVDTNPVCTQMKSRNSCVPGTKLVAKGHALLATDQQCGHRGSLLALFQLQ